MSDETITSALPVPAPVVTAPSSAPSDVTTMALRDVSVSFGTKPAVRAVTFDVAKSQVTALIGPSGSGKTTLLRALNRMHDTVRNAHVTGSVRLGSTDVYGSGMDPTLIRGRIGMVFQRPNPFPTMSIYDNVVSGLRFNGVRKKALLDEAAESALIAAALWDSVRFRLKAGARLSRVGNNNGSVSLAHWLWSQRSCLWTSPHQPWTLRRHVGSRIWSES